MNIEYILNKIKPYLNEEMQISEAEFIEAFGMLKLQEQYEVIKIMIANNIEYVDYKVPKSKPESKQSGPSIAFISENTKKINLTNEQLCLMYQRNNVSALEMLILKNEKFIYECALKINKFYNHKLDIDDLVQVGKIGLINAAKKFDVHSGYAFLTYAWHYIRQSIHRSIRNEGYTIRIPSYIYEEIWKINKLERTTKIYEKKQMIKFIADKTQLPSNKIEWLMTLRENILNTTSLNQIVGEDESSELMGLIVVDMLSVEDEVINKMVSENIMNILDNSLSTREKFVLVHRFGIEGKQKRTLEEVGKMLKLTRERIRQIENKALKKLYKNKSLKMWE